MPLSELNRSCASQSLRNTPLTMPLRSTSAMVSSSGLYSCWMCGDLAMCLPRCMFSLFSRPMISGCLTKMRQVLRTSLCADGMR
jgi:hypothetical protein